jgi:peptidyl-prolyl cis-trans isomerase SurA
MTILKRSLSVLLLSAAAIAPARAGDIVDRIVANVNGHILLESDWQDEVAFEALLNARPASSFSAAERKAALDRLIDQELLREQVHPSESAPAQLVTGRVAEVRKLYPEAATDAGWLATVERYGLTPSAIEKRMGRDIQLMRLVEARLRPAIQIDNPAVETYYRERLLPELQRAGGKEVPLPEVFSRIKDLLVEQKMNQLIAGWLASLRSESHIQIPEASDGEQNR